MGMKDAQGLPGLTVKACLPVTDVFALGYMLTLPYDVHLLVPEDRVSIQMGWQPDVAFAPIEQHHPGQIGAPDAPFESTMPLKFINPWRVKVPDGYSVLFTQPFSRPDSAVHLLFRPGRLRPVRYNDQHTVRVVRPDRRISFASRNADSANSTHQARYVAERIR